MEIKQVIEKSRAYLLSLPNVVGVGEGFKIKDGVNTGERCIVVSVTKKLPMIQLNINELIPAMVLDVITDVVQTGEFRSIIMCSEVSNIDRQGRVRPAPGGVSVGHYLVTAGTIGLPMVFKNMYVRNLVENTMNTRPMILSNNHVLANCGDSYIGDPIYQPGSYDGGTDADIIAKLYEAVPLKFVDTSDCGIASGVVSTLNKVAKAFGRKSRFKTYVDTQFNLVDAAIAEVINPEDVSDYVLEIGKPFGQINKQYDLLGKRVLKYGRTTGLMEGAVTQVNATLQVNYSRGLYPKIAMFEGQIITEKIGEPGDSGSAVFLEGDPPILCGLLFAGSDSATVLNHIEDVCTLLDISVEQVTIDE